MKGNAVHLEGLYKFAEKKEFPHAVIIESSNIEKSYQEINKIINILLCQSDTDYPCGVCSACIKIANQCHPDVKIVSLDKDSKHIKIDQIRFIRQDAHIIPNDGKYKIYILKPADCLTLQAQNAFIKILEEPPERVIFILICESTSNLLDTILSRCEVFRSIDTSTNSTSNSEVYKLAERIVNLSFQKDKLKLLELTADMCLEKTYFKELVSNVIRSFIDVIKTGKSDTLRIMKKIDDLEYLIKAVDKNLNLNLLVTYMVMIL